MICGAHRGTEYKAIFCPSALFQLFFPESDFVIMERRARDKVETSSATFLSVLSRSQTPFIKRSRGQSHFYSRRLRFPYKSQSQKLKVIMPPKWDFANCERVDKLFCHQILTPLIYYFVLGFFGQKVLGLQLMNNAILVKEDACCVRNQQDGLNIDFSAKNISGFAFFFFFGKMQ